MNPTHNTLSSKDFAIGLFRVALATLFLKLAFFSDVAGAQPNLDAEKMAQQRLATIPRLCHKIQDTNLEIDGLPENGTAPVPGSTITLTWTQAGNRSEPLAKHIDGSGLCSFDVAFYTHPDNAALRPHPESVLLAHSEENPVTVVDEGTVGKTVLWQTYQLTFTIPDYDVKCVGGTQVDIYKDVVGSDGTWGDGVGPIEDFDTDDDGEVDRTYRDEKRLVRASNWENVNYPCNPPTTTTTPDDSTTTTGAPTTTTEPEQETTTTTEQESTTTTTVNDTTSTTVPTSSTVVDPTSTTSSTVNVCTSDPSLNNVGRDSNGRFCRLSALPHTGSSTGNLLVLAGSLLTVGGALYLAFRRHRFVW